MVLMIGGLLFFIIIVFRIIIFIFIAFFIIFIALFIILILIVIIIFCDESFELCLKIDKIIRVVVVLNTIFLLGIQLLSTCDTKKSKQYGCLHY